MTKEWWGVPCGQPSMNKEGGNDVREARVGHGGLLLRPAQGAAVIKLTLKRLNDALESTRGFVVREASWQAGEMSGDLPGLAAARLRVVHFWVCPHFCVLQDREATGDETSYQVHYQGGLHSVCSAGPGNLEMLSDLQAQRSGS